MSDHGFERRRLCQKGATIYEEGLPATSTLAIENGVVRLCRYLPSGQRVVAAFAFAGDVIGLDDRFRDCSAEAVTPTMLVERVREDPACEYCGLLAHQVRRITDAMVARSYKTAHAQIAAFLLGATVRHPDRIRFGIALPLADIADHLGLTASTVSRTLTLLRDAGAIIRRRQMIIVISVAMLASIVEHDLSDATVANCLTHQVKGTC